MRLLQFLNDVSFDMCIMYNKISITCIFRPFDSDVEVTPNLTTFIEIEKM